LSGPFTGAKFVFVPQSLAKVYLHLTFSTKARARVITAELQPELHAYMGGILRSIGCRPLEINTEPDHVHVLLDFGRTLTIARMVGELKKGSATWLRGNFPQHRNFHWQAGYGVFSVSRWDVEKITHYIRNQREHHKGFSFQDEFRRLCNQYGVKLDERYAWD
jgi:REP element-mobilizing transposase RayT